MRNDDIQAWNPSEFEGEDSDQSDRGGDEERDSREDFFETHEDEQPVLAASELDSDSVEGNLDGGGQQQVGGLGDGDEDECVESYVGSAASDSTEGEDDQSDRRDGLDEPSSEEEAGEVDDGGEDELSTSSWMDVELPESSGMTSAGVDMEPTHAEATALKTATAPTLTVSVMEYEQMIKDNEALQGEAESLRRAAQQDKETLQSLGDRLKHLETLERENWYLKNEAQKQLMEGLNATEEIKTLNDQLALRGKSEEQLKLQTRQLLEQNRSLQADLLDKIAAETDKIHKMARLSADKQALIQELEEKAAAADGHRDAERRKARRRLLLRLVKRKHRALLLSGMLRWKINAREVASACAKIVCVLAHFGQRSEMRQKAHALRQFMANSLGVAHQAAVEKLTSRVENAAIAARTQRSSHGAELLARFLERNRQRRLASALRALQTYSSASRARAQCLAIAASTLRLAVRATARSALQRAWSRWRVSAHSDGASSRYERERDAEERLAEAKECVFSLSRAKTRLEEKLQAARDEGRHLSSQLDETAAELRLAKHGFVATIVRASERAWVREFFADWRVYTSVSRSSKQLRLQVQMAELRAAERDKHAQSLDEYTQVLKRDLERFQFFSQDKRVAVDVLSKKLCQVEGRYREAEERHAVLEERAHSLKSQLAAFAEWEGVALPFAVLVLCKDLAVENLRELFLLHAAPPVASAAGYDSMGPAGALVVPPAESTPVAFTGTDEIPFTHCGDATADATATTAARLSVDTLVRLVASSSIVTDKLIAREDLSDRLRRHLPSYAPERGLLFHDFLSVLNDLLDDIVAPGDRRYEQIKQFWASLLGFVSSLRGAGAASSTGANGASGTAGGTAASREIRDSAVLSAPRSSTWAGRLSDEILQNQEKLLAVLEHETAVVERAVMEKASLKHTYPPPADEEGEHSPSSGSTFFEYQCDPVLPPDHSPVASPSGSPSSAPDPSPIAPVPATNAPIAGSTQAILEKYANWHQGAQVRDLFLACHRPLLKILVQYSNARRDPRHGGQYCLEHAAVVRMLEDMQLCPAFLSREAIARLFASFQSPADGLLLPQGFALFLGACALELYTTSLVAFVTPRPAAASQAQASPPPPVPYLLSAREVLLSFFGDLGLLAESDVPPPSRLALVGMDVEAILWPLFEYYAAGGGQLARPDDERIVMTMDTFTAFMGEIASMHDKAPAIFRRAMLEVTQTQPRRKRASLRTGAQQEGSNSEADVDAMGMYFDDFYVAIGLVQAERVGLGTSFASAGDAVRQWMQQTQ